MLRLAIYYEYRLGRNDGNPLYVWNELKKREKKNELTIDHLIPYGDMKRFGTYDAHIWVDWGEDGLIGSLPYKPIDCPKPMVYWASDTHLGYDYRLGMAKRSDIVFCAQKRGVDDFKRDGVEATWLPHAVEPVAYYKHDAISKKYDICFVGHVTARNRVEALDRLFKEFPKFFYGQRLFEDAARKYCESKIVFNISHEDDINMRVFEALATNSFLLTNRIPTITDIFKDGKHLVLYDNLDDMIDKAKYYINHEKERNEIAQSGFEEVTKYHTFDNRVTTMLDRITELVSIKETVNENV